MKKIVQWVAIVGVALVIGLLVYNIIKNEQFFEASFSTCLSLLAVIGISFFLSQRLTDKRKQRDIMLKVVESLEILVADSRLYKITMETTEEEILMRNRAISNRISILAQCPNRVGIDEQVRFIQEKFKEYEDFVGNHIKDRTYLTQSEKELRRPIELIDHKTYELMLKLYE